MHAEMMTEAVEGATLEVEVVALLGPEPERGSVGAVLALQDGTYGVDRNGQPFFSFRTSDPAPVARKERVRHMLAEHGIRPLWVYAREAAAGGGDPSGEHVASDIYGSTRMNPPSVSTFGGECWMAGIITTCSCGFTMRSLGDSCGSGELDGEADAYRIANDVRNFEWCRHVAPVAPRGGQ